MVLGSAQFSAAIEHPLATSLDGNVEWKKQELDPIKSIEQGAVDQLVNDLMVGNGDSSILSEDTSVVDVCNRSQQKDPVRGGHMLWGHGFDFETREEEAVLGLVDQCESILSALRSQIPEEWATVEEYVGREIRIGRIQPSLRMQTNDNLKPTREVMKTSVDGGKLQSSQTGLGTRPHVKSIYLLGLEIDSVRDTLAQVNDRNGKSATDFGRRVKLLLDLKDRVRTSYLDKMNSLQQQVW